MLLKNKLDFPEFLKDNLKRIYMNFYEKIRIICLEILYGKAATYGQIAVLCGKAKNSRQVLHVL